MSDQGDNIIRLANALLEQEAQSETHPPLNWKTISLAAMLGVAAGGGAMHWLAEQYRPLNRYEKTELTALIYYLAKQKAEPEQTIKEDVLDHFDIASLDELHLSEFSAVRSYLQRRFP